METPSRHSFTLNGTTRAFPIPAPIKGDTYCRVDVDDVTITDLTKYDIVNNAIVFLSAATVPVGSKLSVYVVQSEEAIELIGNTTNIDIFASNIDAVIAAGELANYVPEITVLADDLGLGGITHVDYGDLTPTDAVTPLSDSVLHNVYLNLDKIESVSGIGAAVVAVDAIATDVTTVATNITDLQAIATPATLDAILYVNAASDDIASTGALIATGSLDEITLNLDAIIAAPVASAAAALSATNAATSETASEVSNVASGVAQVAAELAETNAALSKTAAEQAETNAAASYDSFDDRYLGSKATAPTLDNDGNALLTGAMHWNTGTNSMQAWSGSAWTSVAPVATSVTIGQVVDLTTTLASKEPADATILKDADIGVNVQAYDATYVVDADIGVSVQAYDATIVVDADIGTTVQAYDATILKDADIGVTVLAPTGDASGLTNLPSSGFVSSTFLDQGNLFSRGSANTLTIPDLGGVVNGTLVEVATVAKDLNTAGNWDAATYATAANRAGKDFYVYLLEAGGVILSNNSTTPTGYTASNSRKIAGFHCLCVSVGTITGHSLTGYLTGDILPRSVWDRFNRPKSAPEGMTLSNDGNWIGIYLPSYVGTLLKSVYGGTIADGSNGWHGYKFEQWFGDIKQKLIRQTEFVVASIGSNQGTNISGSVDPVTTGGHSDTAGRRMISDIGCEDMAGALWQWSRDPGGVYSSGAAWVNAYDGNDSGVAGQHYQAPYRAELGGGWGDGSLCGSRASRWAGSPLSLPSNRSARGVSEPAANRL